MLSFMQKKVQDSMETGSKERISRRSYRYQSTDTSAINAVTIRRKYAKELGKQCGLPVDSKTLIRVVDTLPQKTLSDRERKNNLKKALKIGVDGVQWKRVLVVDDIYTTGSTVDAAAAVLREAGVEKIYILSITIGNGYQKEELEWM